MRSLSTQMLRPVDPEDFVPRLEAGRFGRGVFVKLGDSHRREPVGRDSHQEDNDKPQDQVHEGAGADDQDPLPDLLVAEGPGIAGAAVLPFHADKAADREKPQGIAGLPIPEVEEGRAHAEGKLVDPDFTELGGGKMAALVDEDDDGEDEDGNKDCTHDTSWGLR